MDISPLLLDDAQLNPARGGECQLGRCRESRWRARSWRLGGGAGTSARAHHAERQRDPSARTQNATGPAIAPTRKTTFNASISGGGSCVSRIHHQGAGASASASPSARAQAAGASVVGQQLARRCAQRADLERADDLEHRPRCSTNDPDRLGVRRARRPRRSIRIAAIAKRRYTKLRPAGPVWRMLWRATSWRGSSIAAASNCSPVPARSWPRRRATARLLIVVRVLRVERERGLVGRDRLGGAALLEQHLAERRVGVGVLRVELDRVPRGGHRARLVAGGLQRAGQHDVGRRLLGREPGGLERGLRGPRACGRAGSARSRAERCPHSSSGPCATAASAAATRPARSPSCSVASAIRRAARGCRARGGARRRCSSARCGRLQVEQRDRALDRRLGVHSSLCVRM